MSPSSMNRPSEWVYNLLNTTQDKTAGRTSVSMPDSYELIGVDGQVGGGIRPFPGLRLVHEIDVSLFGGSHDGSSEILDLFPFEIVVGDDSYAYGFVYRIRKGNSSTADIYLDMYLEDYNGSGDGRWQQRSRIVKSGVALSPEADLINGKQMDVQTFGRFLYIFVEDREPFLCYVNGVTKAVQILEDSGPGMQPTCISPEKANAIGLGSVLDDWIEDKRPGAGLVMLLDFLPSETGLGLGNGTSTSNGGRVGQEDADVTKLEPGDYAFAYYLHDSATGRRTGLSKIAQARRRDFDPNNAGGTGTGSASSSNENDAVGLYAAIQIDYDSDKYDQAYIYRSVKVQDAGGTFVASILHLDRIIDLEEFHTNNNSSAPYSGTERAQAVYWYELEDKQLVFQSTFDDLATFDEEMPKGGQALWYENTMLVSKISTSAPSTADENRPGDTMGGIGELRWSSLVDISPELFPPANRYVPRNIADDIIAAEQVGPNVIGFSSNKQYLIRKEAGYIKVAEMHEGYGIAGRWACASVGSLIYFVTTKGLKSVDLNGQLDDVRAMDSVIVDRWGPTSLSKVSVAYDATSGVLIVFNPSWGEAFLFWFSTGRVTELRDLGYVGMVTSGNWPLEFNWNFGKMRPGEFAYDAGLTEESYKNPLAQRAFFVVNPPKESLTDNVTEFLNFRIFSIDHGRERLQVTENWVSSSALDFPFDGRKQSTLYEVPGPGVYAVKNAGTLGEIQLTIPNEMSHLPDEVWGTKLYVLWAEDASKIGESCYVRQRKTGTTDTLTLGLGKDDFQDLPEDSIVGLSPVFFKWVGAPLKPQIDEQGMFEDPKNFFVQRRVESLMPAFVDVGGTSLTLLPTGLTEEKPFRNYLAGVYRGNEGGVVGENPCRDENGELVDTLLEPNHQVYAARIGTRDDSSSVVTPIDGPILSPSVTIVVPNMDYRMVAVKMTGHVIGNDRTGRP